MDLVLKESATITFHLASDTSEGVSLVASPLLEAVLSLHVVVNPKHHPLQQPWARRAGRLNAGLRGEIEAFGFAYQSHIPEFCMPTERESARSFKGELAALASTPDDLAALEFSRCLVGDASPRDPRLLRRAATMDAIWTAAQGMPRASRELALLVLEEPQALMERFRVLLASYWEEAFEDEWARLQPVLVDGIHGAARVIAGSGLMAFLEGLRPDVRVNRQAGAFSLERSHDHEVRLAGDDILLMVPSVYVWPDVRVSCDAPWHYGLVYPAPAVVDKARSGIPPQELLKVIRALGDDTRLRVLRIVAEGPRSTQELASLAHVSEATMSKHLRILAEAGVLSSAREGYYVLYALVRERVAYLSAALTAFLTPGCAPRES